jgi:2-polyprenyl-3-methyl-5-hydroxy-6-metoxy-1,4-benzoquinol methylase
MTGVPLVFFPAVGPGAGIGHLTRGLSLLAAVGERGFLYLPQKARDEYRDLIGQLPPGKIISDVDRFPANTCAVFDSRETDPALFSAVSGRALAIGIDEGGQCRDCFPLLVDTLPLVGRKARPNARLLPFQPPGTALRPLRFPFTKILVTFGGEDRAGLSGILLEALLAGGWVSPASLTVISGPRFGERQWPEGVRVIRDCRNVPEVLEQFDLVFTHFGLTVYESLSRGVPVILLNPSQYHRRLARKAGFSEIGVRKVDRSKLKRLLGDRAGHERLIKTFRETFTQSEPLPDFVKSLQPAGALVCPVCSAPSGRALARFKLKSYFRCRICGTIRLVFWGAPKRYATDYFDAEYRAQYGKTYLEDFDHIRLLAAGRLENIWKLMRRRPALKSAEPMLLDVGAAYGPFLAAARERGLAAEGLEMSAGASAHVRDRLGIPCLTGDFLSPEIGVRLGEKTYDIITMWYVIEHFVPTGEALGRVNRLLRPGGIFAFSTPSGSGISFRKNRNLFLEKSPDDHFIVWSLHAARRVLRRYGFRVEKTLVTGHHPERFFARAPGGFLTRLALFASRLFGLGDTFEMYARKTRDFPGGHGR